MAPSFLRRPLLGVCALTSLLALVVCAGAMGAKPVNGSDTIHLFDNTATGATCPAGGTDLTNQTCGDEEIGPFPAAGVFTASVTYPTEYLGTPQIVTLSLCREGTGVTTGDCPISSSPLMGGTGESEASCTEDSTDNGDGTTTE